MIERFYGTFGCDGGGLVNGEIVVLRPPGNLPISYPATQLAQLQAAPFVTGAPDRIMQFTVQDGTIVSVVAAPG